MVRRALTMTAAVLALAACGKTDEKAAAVGEAAPAAANAPVSGPAAMPKRKPGLWSQTVTMAEFSQTTRICLDAAAEAKLSVLGGQATQDMCQQTTMTPKLGGGWTFSSVCDMGSGGKTTSTGTITGDFDTKYRMESDSTTEGAGAPQMNGSRKMVMEAAWQGPCPADFKPGDMEMPNGMKMNLLAMGAMAPPTK
ncbi:DUF3617 family protein [Phenylobacterium sp.]|uniref:DUF3617 domain-containing protein n=1 Tax=Phenylobacterium sp. TaxID=1871053 RepID=UPI00286C8799|nr:DUF3617 family protein [Phenylobacterium sp.]